MVPVDLCGGVLPKSAPGVASPLSRTEDYRGTPAAGRAIAPAFIPSARSPVYRTISVANLTNDPPVRTIGHYLESIHAKIFTKVQNRGVGRRGGR